MYGLSSDDFLLFSLSLIKEEYRKLYHNHGDYVWKIRYNSKYRCHEVGLYPPDVSLEHNYVTAEFYANFIIHVIKKDSKPLSPFKSRFGSVYEFDHLNDLAENYILHHPEKTRSLIEQEKLRHLLK